MKKLLTAVLTLAISSAWAQTFEGTMKWSMKMEVTDPAMKAKMAEGNKKMSDPAEQKKMQDAMNDPKMKAMMEANPAMKAQMEKVMQAQQSGDMSSMIPKGMTIKIKGGNSLTTMEGGMMPMDILHLADKSYRIDRANKTYTVMSSGESKGAEGQQKPKITKTSETMKIVGYNCTKYIATMKEGDRTVTSNIWATTEIKDIDVKALSKQRAGSGQSLFAEGLDGVPLKIESMNKEGNMILEVIEIKRESLNASDFTIPADYKEKQGWGGPR